MSDQRRVLITTSRLTCCAVVALVLLAACRRDSTSLNRPPGEQPRKIGSPDTTSHSPATTHHSPAFADWPKPDVALVITGQMIGYIEPCGCTGLENQKGGLARRHTFIRQLAGDRGWPIIPLDVGSQVKRFGKQ